MRYRTFGGREVSVIALGSTDFGGACPEGQAWEFMDAYRELGGNFIDTARIYGDFASGEPGESERVIGRWLDQRGCRAEIFLSTKGGHPDPAQMHVGRLSRPEVMEDAQRSLESLRTDQVDIYWLHRDDASRPVGDIMETLNALVEAGYTRMIGVSNWRAERIRAANDYARAHGLRPLDADQPQFSLARQMVVEDDTLCQMDAALYRLHAETDMALVPFSSQAKGFFTKLFELGEAGLSPKARRRFYHPENLAIYDRLLQVRAETGLSVGAIALAWLTCQPFPTFPLAGVSRPSHVTALAEAGDAVITPAQRDFLFHF